MRGAFHYPIAVLVSLALHAAASLGFLIAIAPKPTPEQTQRDARLDLATYQVERTEARSQEAEGVPAEEGDAGGTSLSNGVVPKSRARPSLPQASAPREVADPEPVPAEEPDAPRAEAAALPSNATPTVVAEGDPTKPASPQGASALVVSPLADPASAVFPEFGKGDQVELETERTTSLPAVSEEAFAVPPSGEVSEPAIPQTERATTGALPEGELAKVEAAVAPLVAATLPVGDAAAPSVPETRAAGAVEPVKDTAQALRPATSKASPVAPTDQTNRAGTLPASGEILAAEVAFAPILSSAVPTVERVALAVEAAPRVQPAAFRPEPAAPASTEAASLSEVSVEGSRGRPTGVPSEPAVSAVPDPTEAEPGEPDAQAASELSPPVFEALSGEPSGMPAPSLQPPAEATVAALAWSGGAGAEVDPVSLAAIQSFMQAGDVPVGAADPVRDGIEGLLASVPCSRLQTVFDPGTGALELRGHVPEEGLRGPVLTALRAQVGDAIPVAENVRILPRPQCGALAGIASAGLPQSEAQDRDPKVVGEGAHARVYTFQDGDRLEFELTGPDYPAFFYIDYFDAKGQVLHLQPNEYVPLEAVGIKEILPIGSDRTDKPSLSITVAPPFGQEIMVAFVSSEPLFEGLRPISEPAAPYLKDLQLAVAAARARDPQFKGEWVYFFVETRAR